MEFFLRTATHERIALCDVVRDSVTGFEGVALSMARWSDGRIQVRVYDGTEPQYFDLERLDLVRKYGVRETRTA